MTELNSHEFMSLLDAAMLAPSADNKRIFRLQHVHSGVRLWGDETFTSGPKHRRILGLVAVGAAVENMRVRAIGLGFDSEVTWFPDEKRSKLIAELVFQRTSSTTPDPLEVALGQRHTNRRVFFRGPGLSRSELSALAAEVDEVEGVHLHWFDSPEKRQQILRLVRIAETDRFRLRELHDELFSAVRFDLDWKTSANDGLPPGSLEIEPWMRPMFRSLRHWKVSGPLRAMGIHHLLGLRAGYLPCRLAPHVGVLTTSLDPEAGPIAAGAAFERIWLRMTVLGMSLQPLAGSAVLALPDCEWVSPSARAKLTEGWAQLAPGRLPMMLFRVGRARPPSVRTVRPARQDYCYVPG
ncbi:hypothetical protein MB901379_01284 [Mycobacterium basiliense]|uniref:Nitroreductase family protein n=1 Tax=Mycobacterium basiliense TaxID=2094119 RepID=A0A3S4C9X8_9MYCO|nr:hypothetical protein [Mycobacterium basiliense]VDM87739.1 hypothetical protein MB901379_01284 [Mycobacterium basiliense]